MKVCTKFFLGSICKIHNSILQGHHQQYVCRILKNICFIISLFGNIEAALSRSTFFSSSVMYPDFLITQYTMVLNFLSSLQPPARIKSMKACNSSALTHSFIPFVISAAILGDSEIVLGNIKDFLRKSYIVLS